MRGQGTVEYGLLIATVAILVLIGGVVYGDTLQTWFGALLQRITVLPP